jgi:hypothetical protein
MGQGVTFAGLACSARSGSALPGWHASCFLELTSSASEALRGVVVPGLTSIRQGLLGPTPRIRSVRGSGFGSDLSDFELSESRPPAERSRDYPFALREQPRRHRFRGPHSRRCGLRVASGGVSGVRRYALSLLPFSRSARRYRVLRSIPRIFAAWTLLPSVMRMTSSI